MVCVVKGEFAMKVKAADAQWHFINCSNLPNLINYFIIFTSESFPPITNVSAARMMWETREWEEGDGTSAKYSCNLQRTIGLRLNIVIGWTFSMQLFQNMHGRPYELIEVSLNHDKILHTHTSVLLITTWPFKYERKKAFTINCHRRENNNVFFFYFLRPYDGSMIA